MKKVITYGTYDLLHFGHIRLLERARALGDYLIVGVTADDFDKTRGKINVQQSLMERVEAVRATGLADEIIIEEYEGQKIDDIHRYGIDIFTVGSDWKGKFDYLREYCEVVYLPRTEGISSSEIRTEQTKIKIGLVGNSPYLRKFFSECKGVNGLSIEYICTLDTAWKFKGESPLITNDYDLVLDSVDAVYLHSAPDEHYGQIKKALMKNVHVMCESPLASNAKECAELFTMARKKGLVLMESLRTAYATAFDRLILLVKSGKIGEIVSVESVCTSLRGYQNSQQSLYWNSITAWGPTALLPVFKLLGTNYKNFSITTRFENESNNLDAFTKIDFIYDKAIGTIKVGFGVKADSCLIISGTKGYVYVPSPWWKTDYFEIRYENSNDNKRYYYQLDGEGIPNELVAMIRLVRGNGKFSKISEDISIAIADIVSDFNKQNNMTKI